MYLSRNIFCFFFFFLLFFFGFAKFGFKDGSILFFVFFLARGLFFFSFRIGRKPELYNDLIRLSGETLRDMVKVGLDLV